MSRIDKKELKQLIITKISERLVRDTMGELSGVCVASQGVPNKITFTLLSALTEQDLMQLLAHKLKMEDKMLALVEIGIEDTSDLSDSKAIDFYNANYTVEFDYGSIPRPAAIITYGVEK